MTHIVFSLKKFRVKLRKNVLKKPTKKTMQNTYNTLFIDTDLVVWEKKVKVV